MSTPQCPRTMPGLACRENLGDDQDMSANDHRLRVFSDWNGIGEDGVPLSDIQLHLHTDFAALEGRSVLLEDSGEVVEAVIYQHADGRWWGRVDWDTQRDAAADEVWPDAHPAVW